MGERATLRRSHAKGRRFESPPRHFLLQQHTICEHPLMTRRPENEGARQDETQDAAFLAGEEKAGAAKGGSGDENSKVE